MSRFYRPVDAGIHGDEKFRGLSDPQPCGKYLIIYLLIGEHTDGLPGLYKLGEAALAEALGWPVEGLRGAFAELASREMALADWNARVVFLPNALKYQPPSNPKHLQGWGKMFRRIPECPLKDDWLQKLIALAERLGEPYLIALNEGFDTVCHTVCDTVSDRVSPPNPNPNPNTKPNAPNAASQGDRGDASLDDEPVPFGEIIGALNERSGKRYRHGTAATHRHIQARWREGYRRPDFEAVIETKCSQWLGTSMEMYLRPETLFGPKFEGYLNEKSTASADSLYPDLEHIEEDSDDS